MVIREIFSDPITRSNYNSLIKSCLRMWGHNIANKIGALIVEFRDSTLERSNFKVSFYIEKTKYATIKVQGGFGKLTRTKYKVNMNSIERYDWRAKVWRTVKKIGCHFYNVPYLLSIKNINRALNYFD
ncbi:hypothetical protein SteCoe_11884 [Stentor coeruleus]|uniref:Uncharacterized protein n=1 Tax=Stentor coeruleus TaxID=5963 RepID=A0A1R2CC49_9CILI|nr:hypothetical protein SteCoe_11884 [Stentor coeruleus]